MPSPVQAQPRLGGPTSGKAPWDDLREGPRDHLREGLRDDLRDDLREGLREDLREAARKAAGCKAALLKVSSRTCSSQPIDWGLLDSPLFDSGLWIF